MSPQRAEASPEPIFDTMPTCPKSSADSVDSAGASDHISATHIPQSSRHCATINSAKASTWTRATAQEDRTSASLDYHQRANTPGDATVGRILEETRPRFRLQEPRAATEEDFTSHLRQSSRDSAASFDYHQRANIPGDATLGRILRETRLRLRLEEPVPEVRREDPNVQDVGSCKIDPIIR